jgi:hypothetical protein
MDPVTCPLKRVLGSLRNLETNNCIADKNL